MNSTKDRVIVGFILAVMLAFAVLLITHGAPTTRGGACYNNPSTGRVQWVLDGDPHPQLWLRLGDSLCSH